MTVPTPLSKCGHATLDIDAAGVSTPSTSVAACADSDLSSLQAPGSSPAVPQATDANVAFPPLFIFGSDDQAGVLKHKSSAASCTTPKKTWFGFSAAVAAAVADASEVDPGASEPPSPGLSLCSSPVEDQLEQGIAEDNDRDIGNNFDVESDSWLGGEPASPGLSACSDPVNEQLADFILEGDLEELTDSERIVLDKARSFTSRNCFSMALKECMSAISGFGAITRIARDICDAWECADRQRALKIEEHRESAIELRRILKEKNRDLSHVRMENAAQLLRAEARQQETEKEVTDLRQRLISTDNTAQAQLAAARTQSDAFHKVLKEKEALFRIFSSSEEEGKELGRKLKEKEERLLKAEARLRQMEIEATELRRRLQGSEMAAQKSAVQAQEQQNSLMAQLMASRDRADEYKKALSEKDSRIQKLQGQEEHAKGLRNALREKEAQVVEVKAKQQETEAEVLKLRQRLRASHETAPEVLRAEEQQNLLMAQLLSARERADESKKEVKEKESQLQKLVGLEAGLRQEFKEKQAYVLKMESRRRETEAEIADLQRRCKQNDGIAKECARLRRELSEVRSAKSPRASTHLDLVRQVAALECLSFQRAGPSERAAMKKKLLLKWHPDKQASTDNASFATQVMQELQNRPEWN